MNTFERDNPSAKPTTQSHDSAAPPNLISFMPAKYRGIGVRIEDDVLVTKTGCNNLSTHIPSEVRHVEEWIRRICKSR
jgi:Xaa-Pro aminopeptidase